MFLIFFLFVLSIDHISVSFFFVCVCVFMLAVCVTVCVGGLRDGFYLWLCVCVFVFALVCCVSVVVSVVCMCSYMTGGYVCGMVHQFFGCFFVWSFDMFRRWYYVV